jgi:hypothetical protein
MIVVKPLFFFLVGWILILLALMIRVYPDTAIQIVSPILAGIGAGMVGSFFFFTSKMK